MHTQAEAIQGLRTPRAAAVAGILFSLLLMASMLLIRTSIPADPLAAVTNIVEHADRLMLALNLLPFAGICFLWFVGVLRDRLGKKEDRFFSTVFLGSALLFLAMIFVTGSVAGGMIRMVTSGSRDLIAPGTYALVRIGIYQAMHFYAVKMAGVFMISTSTVALRTHIVPRWMALLGYALALTLIVTIESVAWVLLVFPLWVLFLSVHILIDNFRAGAPAVVE